MTRLLVWLRGRFLLFLVLASGFALTALVTPYWPGWSEFEKTWGQEARGLDAAQTDLQTYFAEQQKELHQTTEEAKKKSSNAIKQSIQELATERQKVEAKKRKAQEWPWRYSLKNLKAATEADIRIFAIDQEVAVLEAALKPRKALETTRAAGAALLKVPSIGEIEQARTLCDQSTKDFDKFKKSWPYAATLRNIIYSTQRKKLSEAQEKYCEKYNSLNSNRKENIGDNARILKDYQNALIKANAAKVSAQKTLDALEAGLLPEELKRVSRPIDPRQILIEAGWWLLVITLAPFAYRAIAYFVLAPIAASRPPMRFAASGAAPPQPVASPSAISQAITLGGHDEVLVRQDYLQSSSLAARKGFRWLLDWRRPLTSLASGMRFLTAISGADERVTVSAVKDPFAELAVLTLPEGAACILRPSALAAVVQPQGEQLRITSHWRIFSLPALLTWQWPYLAFHGPARLVVKGGRGVRIEPAARGRIVGEGQILGFSTDLAYAVIRSETFWPYFFGREALLKDRIEAGGGVLLIEEAPLAGKSGVRRGIEGLADAALKLVGI